MVYTIPEQLKQIRRATSNDEDEFSGSSTVEMMYYNQAQDTVFDSISDMRPDILSNSFTITLDGSLQYYMPDYAGGYFNYDQILVTEDATDSDNPLVTTATNWSSRYQYIGGNILSGKVVYSIRDQYIELPRKTTGVTLRVWYTRRPVDLSYGTVGADAGSTDITFATTPTGGSTRIEDDYYNGMRVVVNGQVRTITDYVGSTKKATVSSWTTNPTTSDTYSIISPLPERAHKLIILEAIKAIRMDQEDPFNEIQNEIDRETSKITGKFRRPTRQGPWRPKQISRN